MKFCNLQWYGTNEGERILNTNRKRIIIGIALILFCLSMVVGCEKIPEKSTYPYGKMKADFQFIVQDVFTIKNSGKTGVVVTGINENSPLYTGTEVNVISEAGTITPTVIGGIEEFQMGITEGVPEGTNIGIELEGLTAEDVAAGDKIILK